MDDLLNYHSRPPSEATGDMLKYMELGKLNAYAKHGNRLVKGWVLPGAIQAIVGLAEEQRKTGISGGVAEIGVHHGRLFILLYLLGDMGERAVAVDLFTHQELNIDHSGAGDLASFKKNLKRHADTNRLVLYEGDSMKLDSQQLIDLGGGDDCDGSVSMAAILPKSLRTICM